jgi:hypothetical protein
LNKLFSKLFIFCTVLYCIPSYGENVDFIHKVLNSTFRISGGQSVGTCFMIGKRLDSNPQNYYPVFITAAHVLDGMKADSAVIYYRIKKDDNYIQLPISFRINDNGKKTYFKHKSLDLAAFYIKDLNVNRDYIIIQGSLANDEAFKTYDIKIGDELCCLGYPYNIVYNETGLPILRSGKIASYPLIPSNKYPTFLFDINVFPGNSGGPVFIYSENRSTGGVVDLGSTVFSIVGIVIEQIQKTSTAEDITINKSLQLGQVINSNLIKEFVMTIPDSLTIGRSK